ncbi:MAG: hypothetical protein ACRDFS_08585, partial [Chloroflexota bacterium]
MMYRSITLVAVVLALVAFPAGSALARGGASSPSESGAVIFQQDLIGSSAIRANTAYNGNGDVRLSSGPLISTVGQAYSRDFASIEDFDGSPGSEFSITVNWGDGTSSSCSNGCTNPNGDLFLVYSFGVPSSGDIFGSHTYTHGGLYAYSITVTDNDGGGLEPPVTDFNIAEVYPAGQSPQQITNLESAQGTWAGSDLCNINPTGTGNDCSQSYSAYLRCTGNIQQLFDAESSGNSDTGQS